MFSIYKKDCHLENCNLLITEASTIGLPASEWPEFIAVLDNSQIEFLFQKSHPDLVYGGIAGYYYQSKERFKLLIIND